MSGVSSRQRASLRRRSWNDLVRVQSKRLHNVAYWLPLHLDRDRTVELRVGRHSYHRQNLRAERGEANGLVLSVDFLNAKDERRRAVVARIQDAGHLGVGVSAQEGVGLVDQQSRLATSSTERNIEALLRFAAVSARLTK